jgi:hypothetical protein
MQETTPIFHTLLSKEVYKTGHIKTFAARLSNFKYARLYKINSNCFKRQY